MRSSSRNPLAGMVPAREMAMSPPSPRLHPSRSIPSGPGLCSSIHSSLAEASVPAQAISLMRMEPGARGVGEGTGVSEAGVGVGVASHTELRLLGVPEIALPWASFPTPP